jgi:hypothetical protein
MADTDLENVHQSRKPRTAKEDDGDATTAISDSSYQAPGTEDVATGKVSPIAAEVFADVSHRKSNACSFWHVIE